MRWSSSIKHQVPHARRRRRRAPPPPKQEGAAPSPPCLPAQNEIHSLSHGASRGRQRRRAQPLRAVARALAVGLLPGQHGAVPRRGTRESELEPRVSRAHIRVSELGRSRVRARRSRRARGGREGGGRGGAGQHSVESTSCRHSLVMAQSTAPPRTHRQNHNRSPTSRPTAASSSSAPAPSASTAAGSARCGGQR